MGSEDTVRAGEGKEGVAGRAVSRSRPPSPGRRAHAGSAVLLLIMAESLFKSDFSFEMGQIWVRIPDLITLFG